MFDRELFGLPGMHKACALLLLSSLAQAAFVIAQMLALAQALSALWAQQPLESQAPSLATFALCFMARQLIVLVQDECVDRFALRTANDLRRKLVEKTFSTHADLAHNMGTAATATAATEGIDDIARYVRVLPPKMCGLAGTGILLLSALFAIDWVSGVICLVTLPVTVFFMIMLGKQAKDRAARQFGAYRRLSNHFIDTVRGIEAIHALGAGGRIAESVRQSSERLRAETVKTLSVATLSSAILDLVSVFGLAAVAMLLAFRLMDGSLALVTGLSALLLAPEYFGAIRSFSSDFHASLDGKNALASVLSLISEGAAPADGETTFPTWSDEASLEARGLAFTYDGKKPALENASFSVRGAARVGIVGESGAGKSTLVNLITGLAVPSAGAVFANGSPASFCDSAWKRQLHYIPQSPHLFAMSLADNIRFYAPNAPLSDVERAVKAVGLETLVEKLPEGLNTVVGEGGRNLSGGETHRVALARTLVDERPVLLFDEPTAHLDIETELALKRRMLACMDGKLVFFATHRLHWLKDMDMVLVVKDGSIVESGAPNDLLSRDSVLRRLVRAGREHAA